MKDKTGELPDGWEVAPLQDVCDIIMGQSPPSSTYRDEPVGLPFFQGKAEFGELYPTPRKWCVEPSKIAEPDDILLSIRAPVGPTNVSTERCCIGRGLMALRPACDVEGRFVLHSLRHLEDKLASLATGSTFEAVSGKVVSNFDIRVPPVSEQRRIVAKIEALQERSRKAREALAEVGPLLEQFRQSLLAAAYRGDLTADWRAANPNVEPASELLNRIRQERRQRWEQSELAKYEAKGKQPPKAWQDKYVETSTLSESELPNLPDIPDNWVWSAVEELVEPGVEIVYGIVQPGPNLDEGVPYVRGLDIQDGQIIVDQLWKTSPQIAERYNRSSLEGGDVLLGIIRNTKVAIVPVCLSGCNMGRATARIRPSCIITPHFLSGSLQAPHTQRWLHSESRGIDMPIINVGKVRRTPIALAPLEEQLVINAMVDNWTLAFNEICRVHEEAEIAMTDLDQSILAKAFRGDLVPQDPNDEPASELLARIRRMHETSERQKDSKPVKATKSTKRKSSST